MRMLLVDFETRSRVDLKKCGADVYAKDPSTEILCAAFGTYGEDTPKVIWYPGDPIPEFVHEYLKADRFIAAHNARFDALIWENCGEKAGLPVEDIYPERWYCTSAQCRVNALPASLDDAARALGLRARKDHRGAALIRKLSIPRKDGTFLEDPKLLKQMGEYCLQDLKVMHAIMRSTRPMTEAEHMDWLVNEEINDRGVLVDLFMAMKAQHYATAETHSIGMKLSKLTDGEVTRHTQTARAAKYVYANLPAPLKTLMHKYVKGEKRLTLDKNVRAQLLGRLDSTEHAYRVVDLIDTGNKSSVSKFARMYDRSDPYTDRVHGAFVYAGATQTLRFASRGLQLHNLRRDCWTPEQTEDLLDLMDAGKPIAKFGDLSSTMDVLAKALRPAIIPDDDKVLVVGDWSGIEARALAWAASKITRLADKRLKKYHDNEEIYLETAEAIGYKGERQVGKVAELALGYAGGEGALAAMASGYGIEIHIEARKRIVQRWRTANPWAVRLWEEIERAAIAAVQLPNKTYTAGPFVYICAPGTCTALGNILYCILPSGQAIQYPDVKLTFEAPYWDPEGRKRPVLSAMKAGWLPAADEKDWPRVTLWRGLLVENAIQAFCADLLRRALRALRWAPVVAHVHDEIILEVPEAEAGRYTEQLKQEMERAPSWADGLPLQANPTAMLRYGKE